MKKIIVLGAGMVGSAIALDLAQNYQVTSIDIKDENLLPLKNIPGIKTQVADLTKSENIKRIIADCDLVVNAVPGFMGYRTTKAVIEAGKIS